MDINSKVKDTPIGEMPLYRLMTFLDGRPMWVNQPSKNQDYHRFHGQKVVACGGPDKDGRVNVCFLFEIMAPNKIPQSALSDGWQV